MCIPADAELDRNAAGESAIARPKSEAVEALRARVGGAVKEADRDLQMHLKHVWCLGPHHSGPNVLLATRVEAAGGSSLFSASPSEVISIGRRAGKFTTFT